jgi:lysophospholipase L1-like esterase
MKLENRHIDIWGDSILKGIILDETDGRYKVLENNCVQMFSEKTGATINNHASFGMTSAKATERIARNMERRTSEENDIVIVEFGGNDCDYHWNEISENPDREHIPNTPISLFGDTLQKIIDTFRKKGLDPILMALPPLEPNRYFEWISRGLVKTNILKWLGDVNKIYRWQEAYNDVVRQIAELNNLRLINIRKDFLISDHYTDQICKDGIHPNQLGQKTILDSCLNFVNAL